VAPFRQLDPFHIELFGSKRSFLRLLALGVRIALQRFDRMDSLTMTAASGMRSRLDSLDMLANNLANSSTPGFKADREFYNVYVSESAAEGNDGQSPVTSPLVEKQWTDFSQGTLTPTSNPLDLAITGNGFFAVSSPSGTLYTRDGSFRLSPQGELQTQEGYAVLDADGNPIVLDSSKQTEIDADGTLHQNGVIVGQLNVVDFSKPQALAKQGQNYFFADNGTTPAPAGQAQVQQGKLESANFQTAESAVRLITVMRQFETLQKAMSVGTDMNKKAVEEVARVE
jgi:flagellar basal-body rod protein FlgF